MFAAPLGSPDAVDMMRSYADEVVCLETPPFYFYATVGQGYYRFRETSDDEVVALLDVAGDGFRDVVVSGADADPPLRDEEVQRPTKRLPLRCRRGDGVAAVDAPCWTIPAGRWLRPRPAELTGPGPVGKSKVAGSKAKRP